MPGAKAVLKAEHLNPFISATLETFAAMLYTAAKPGKVSLESGRGARRDISGVISLSGLSGHLRGSVALGFPRITALKVASAFTGRRLLALDDAVSGAIGELAQLVAGSAKLGLGGYDILVSPPTVVMGDDHVPVRRRDFVQVTVPFESSLGPFDLAVRIRNGAGSPIGTQP